MNKLLNKKKAPPEPIATPADAFLGLASPPSTPPLPHPKKPTTSRWRRNKRAPEPRPELNIAAALPSSDELRTSLLMPNLSARFSMLREQDDPNSLLGKASDDSVLQPRRRSRLDFGFGASGLSDIAEVQSVHSSIRPPFAFGPRDSCASDDGYGSENDSSYPGSVMSRARPGEGNVLFGGRQKVYKIPTSGASSSTGLGRALYEDDIGQSAFQRYRREQRQADDSRPSHDFPGFDFGLEAGGGDGGDGGHDRRSHDDDGRGGPAGELPTPNDSAKDLSHSPSVSSWDKKRSTTSSTARSEARSSTAATSVASQPATATALQPHAGTAPVAPVAAAATAAATASTPPAAAPPSLKRSDTKTRRLYEQGLNQDIYEQQTTALSRLNSIQRQRGPPRLHSARSAGNLHDKPSQPVYALRAQSPPPAAAPLSPLATFGSVRKASRNSPSPLASGAQSPVSPLDEFEDADVLTQALEPRDRGKATAMGAFNKPAQQFDEKQYLERQQQLVRSQSKAGVRKDSNPAAAALRQRMAAATDPAAAHRERAPSDASVRSRSRSLPQRQDSLRKAAAKPTKPYNVFQNAASQLPSKPASSPVAPPPPPPPQQPQQYDTHRTFFGNISASDSEEDFDDDDAAAAAAATTDEAGDAAPAYRRQSPSEYGYGAQPGRWQPTPLPSVSEHPAARPSTSGTVAATTTEGGDADLEPKPLRLNNPSSRSLRTDAPQTAPPPPPEPPVDSPTLGQEDAEPLNGMVHHLRQKSNTSSIYPNDDKVPEMPDMPWNTGREAAPGAAFGSEPESRVQSYTNSNPWDLDEAEGSTFYDGVDSSVDSPVDTTQSPAAFSPRAPSGGPARDRQSETSQDSAWQGELRKQRHTRDVSTATQQEREAFANELAARRNAIQENIKSIVERDNQSRGASPVPSASGAFKPFGALKTKSSRLSGDSADARREPAAPPKAMKMLGMSGAPAPAPSPVGGIPPYERSGSRPDVQRPREASGSRPRPMPSQPPPRAPPAGGRDTSQTRPRQPSGPASPPSHAGRTRARSITSEAPTGRSRSRTGPYRDDLERAMVEGVGHRAAGHPELPPMRPQELTPTPSPEMMQHAFDHPATRARSNSRAAVTANYVDASPGQPIPTAPLSGRLAPGAPSPSLYSPAGSSARPSPAVSPIIPNPTPPVSGANTPQSATFTPMPMPVVPPRQGRLRKKTISKSDISEPTLISSTSNVDTVELPEGASLKNGMDEPPPLPPINPRRRTARKMFGRGRGEISAEAASYAQGTFHARSKTPDLLTSRTPPDADVDAPAVPADNPPRHPSDGRVGVPPPKQSLDSHSTPALQQYGYPPPNASPERLQRPALPQHAVSMEGGMF